MLMTMKAQIEGLRALMYTNAAAIDRSKHHPDPTERERQGELVGLLTPICKAFGTDLGVELTSLGVQIHGGMGYIEETGAAQHFRDSRIAADLRGDERHPGRRPRRPQAAGAGRRRRCGSCWRRSAGSTRSWPRPATSWPPCAPTSGSSSTTSRSPPTGCWRAPAPHPTTRSVPPAPYLKQFGYVLCGWLLAKAALAARRLLGEELGGGFDAEFLRAKIATARFYATNVLPQAGGLLGAVTAGSDDLFAIEPKYLAG